MNALAHVASPYQFNPMNVEWEFLTKLRDLGRDTATRWLDENFAAIGERSTVDLREMFQGIGAEHQGG